MRKEKLIEHSKEVNQVLKIGELHEEIENKKHRKKIQIIPISMTFIGIILILTGVFFGNIKSFIDKNKPTNKPTIEEKNPDEIILTCVSKTSNDTIGITTTKTTRYEFINKLLQNITITEEKVPEANKEDIATENLKVYYEQYKKVGEDLKDITGLKISSTLKDTKLTFRTIIDFNKIDIKTVPKNDYVIITNTKEDTYRSIKEQEGRAGHICKVE